MADAAHASESVKNDILELLDMNQWPQAVQDHWIQRVVNELLVVYGKPRASGNNRLRITDLGSVKQTKPGSEKRRIQDRRMEFGELVAGSPGRGRVAVGWRALGSKA